VCRAHAGEYLGHLRGNVSPEQGSWGAATRLFQRKPDLVEVLLLKSEVKEYVSKIDLLHCTRKAVDFFSLLTRSFDPFLRKAYVLMKFRRDNNGVPGLTSKNLDCTDKFAIFLTIYLRESFQNLLIFC